MTRSPAPPPSPGDRRSGQDRRRADKGPPHGRERRLSLEPRKPEVVELEISESEWMSLHALDGVSDSAFARTEPQPLGPPEVAPPPAPRKPRG